MTRIKGREAKLRKEWIEANGPCKDCGSTENLEIDHVDPDQKEFTVSFSEGKAKREAELAKCQILCHDCHLKKTKRFYRILCKRGHFLTKNNIIYKKDGTRKCRKCQNENNKRYMRKIRGGIV